MAAVGRVYVSAWVFDARKQEFVSWNARDGASRFTKVQPDHVERSKTANPLFYFSAVSGATGAAVMLVAEYSKRAPGNRSVNPSLDELLRLFSTAR